MIALTISIVTANNKKLILDCLRSIYGTIGDLATEVFVVINASSDDSEQAIKEEFPQVALLINKKKRGFTHDHNSVMRIGTGKYFLVLNDDTIILGNALARMIDYMDANPDVGVLGCKVLNADRTLQWSCGVAFNHKFEFFKAGVIRTLIPFLPTIHYKTTKQVTWVSGACLLARAQATQEVGLFDENIIIYFEDSDLCYRMIKGGWKVVFYPWAEIVHYHGQTRKKNLVRDTFIIYQSWFYFFSKYYSRSAQLLVRLITVLEATLRYLRTRLLLPSSDNQRQKLLNTYKRVLQLALIPFVSTIPEK